MTSAPGCARMISNAHPVALRLIATLASATRTVCASMGKLEELISLAFLYVHTIQDLPHLVPVELEKASKLSFAVELLFPCFPGEQGKARRKGALRENG